MIENIKPMDIEKRSFAIITELLGDTKLEEENELVIKRVIHTTADFDYVQNLVFSPHAVTKGLDALRAGCHIVTDTQMAKAGINKTILGRLGGEVHCFMSDADVAAEAKERGVTRAIVSMEKAAQLRSKQAAAAPAGEFAVISESGEADAEVEALIRARADAKKAKNFGEADRIRDELKAKGIEVTDIPNGAKWKRI